MGLIKAGLGAVGGVLADQWKEFFYCEALDMDTLVVKGEKRVSGRSSNTKGSDNLISNGSGIAVADGQCMIIVEQGKVVEVCAEPGEYTYDTSTEPSIFAGSFGDSLKETFKAIGKRFTYGGDTGKDQRVYYFNTKEIMGNKFGTPSPIIFEVMNKQIGFSRTVNVRCNGIYSYIISNPLLFYTKVCGNVEQAFTRDQIDEQMKTEFVSALQPAFGALAELELRPAQLPAKVNELKKAMNDALQYEWVSIDEFIEFAYDELDLGYGSDNDGVLLLVCMDPREYRILSNGFAADAISLDAIDSIGNAIVNDLSDDDYMAAFERFAEESEYYLDGHINGFPFKLGKNLLISLVIGLVIALIVTGSMKSKLKSVRKQPAATEYTKPGSMQVTYSNDFFLYRVVDRKKKESKSSSSSGSSRNVGGGSFQLHIIEKRFLK